MSQRLYCIQSLMNYDIFTRLKYNRAAIWWQKSLLFIPFIKSLLCVINKTSYNNLMIIFKGEGHYHKGTL